MKRLMALIWFILGASVPTAAQSQFSILPDCMSAFALNAVGASAAFVNTQGCVSWTLVYNSSGFSALSLVFQSAEGIPGGVPGSFGTYAGTVDTGVNPNTSTTGAVTVFSNGAVSTPFVRVNLASASGAGFLQGVFYGYRTGSNGSSGGGGGMGCTGTSGTPCIVAGPDAPGNTPTQAPVEDGTFDGTDTQRLKSDTQGRILQGAYPVNASVSLTSSGLTQLIAASGSEVITVNHFSIGFASSVNFQLEYGTGSNCGTGTTAVTGVYQVIQGLALDVPLAIPSGKALCANLGASVTGGGFIIYNQQ
jgi:hypothetical protein